MARLSRQALITEKIDGTNAQIVISKHEDGEITKPMPLDWWTDEDGTRWEMRAGSRKRWITQDDDNFGFAGWVYGNRKELRKLGQGRHFGEWWGQGIQRKYDMDEKAFSLFNAYRWAEHDHALFEWATGDPSKFNSQESAPSCCRVVPLLSIEDFSTIEVDRAMNKLRTDGSHAAPGFMAPEGVVVYHLAGGVGFKKTFDDSHKG